MIEPSKTETEIPISARQRRIWFLDRFEVEKAVNQSAWLYPIPGPVDFQEYRKALRKVVDAHEVLRMAFPERDGQPFGLVSDLVSDLEFTDLSHLPPDQALRAAREQAKAFARERFDVTRGPLYRARLYKVGTNYLFMWCAHHLIFEEESRDLFWGNFGDALLGRPIQAGTPFREIAQRENAFRQTAGHLQNIAHWKQVLSGVLPVLQLPMDRPRPAVQTFRGSRRSLSISSECVRKLYALSSRAGDILENSLLVAYQVLLYRHSGQEKAIIGIRSFDASAIGPTSWFEIHPADLSGSPTFRELLERDTLKHHSEDRFLDTPVEDIIDALKLERNLSYHPVFQTVFSRGRPLAESFVGSLDHNTPFDLSLTVHPSGQEISVSFEFNCDLFEHSTIQRMLGHYRMLVESVCENPDQPIDSILMLTEEEQTQLLVEWNATPGPDDSGVSLHQRFERQVAATPDAVAVIFGEQSLSYEALNKRANQLARRLQSLGVAPGMRVGISMHRSFEMLTAILAILKTGAGYVPLDPVMPSERLAYMVADARLSLILTQERFVATLEPHGIQLLALDAAENIPSSEADTNLESPEFSDSLVYITYTSGSTGQPKGIEMTQRPLLNLLGWMIRTTNLPPQARTLQFASLSFDVSFQDIFSTWLSGGTLVLITEAQRQDLASLAQILDTYGVHRIFLPAVALQQLAEGFCAGEYECRNLRKVISGSEQLMITDAVRRMFTALPECRLHNEYGPSETHVVTELGMEGHPDTWVKRPAVGRPITNTQIYILDRVGNPTPIGVPGELYIGGAGLARGYIGREALTAEKFIADRFSNRPGARLYRTGDQARWLADGTIEFIGRLDHQMKIRGYRIEPGDIEAALEKHALIKESCIVAHEFGEGDKRLVAYLGVNKNATPGVSEIRSFLADKLPEYMIPSSYVMLDALPLNANGKIDRKALPPPEATRPSLDSAYLAPQGKVEQRVAELWKETLKLDQVGVRDNFFDLGGNSIMIVRIHQRLKQEMGGDIPLIALFQFPTIDTLARFLEKQNGSAPAQASTEITSRAAKQREALAKSRAQFSARPRP